MRIVVDLPAPFGPDEAGHAARTDGEGEVVDRERAAVSLAQPVCFDGRVHDPEGTRRRRSAHRAQEPSFTTPVAVTGMGRVTLGREGECRGPGRCAAGAAGRQ